jgi:hypothetical protein
MVPRFAAVKALASSKIGRNYTPSCKLLPSARTNDLDDPGLRNPRRNLLICVGVTLVACAFIAWGAVEMVQAGGETDGSGLKIGLALLPAILGPAAAFNFWRGVKVFAAIKRGENEIGRWTVTAADLAGFAAVDDDRNAHGGVYRNVWTRPRDLPAAGLEIIFVADAVLVGDTYYALVTTGLFKFTAVGMLVDCAPTIEFVTVTTSARGGGSLSVRRSVAALRLPVSGSAGAEAAAARVLDHFRRVLAREIIVNPHFYRRRMRIGLIGAPICFAIALVGYLLDGDGLPDIMLALGMLIGVAMLVLALVAWKLDQAQRRKR